MATDKLKKQNIFKKLFYKFIRMQLYFFIVASILTYVLFDELKGFNKYSIEKMKKNKNRNKNKSKYDYTTLLILTIFPITNILAIDRFYINNPFAIVKIITNVFFGFLTAGISWFIWWLVDLVKVTSCNMVDGDGKYVCRN